MGEPDRLPPVYYHPLCPSSISNQSVCVPILPSLCQTLCVPVTCRTTPCVPVSPSLCQSVCVPISSSLCQSGCVPISSSLYQSVCVPVPCSTNPAELGHGGVGTRQGWDSMEQGHRGSATFCLSACQPACIMVFRV